jgi:hypothetical protein
MPRPPTGPAPAARRERSRQQRELPRPPAETSGKKARYGSPRRPGPAQLMKMTAAKSIREAGGETGPGPAEAPHSVAPTGQGPAAPQPMKLEVSRRRGRQRTRYSTASAQPVNLKPHQKVRFDATESESFPPPPVEHPPPAAAESFKEWGNNLMKLSSLAAEAHQLADLQQGGSPAAAASSVAPAQRIVKAESSSSSDEEQPKSKLTGSQWPPRVAATMTSSEEIPRESSQLGKARQG